VRGATTVDRNDREEILRATRELLALVIHLNGIHGEDVASVIFTTTPDLDAAFPATAARQLGWLDVPLMCSHEIDVPGSLGMCIRVLIHWNTAMPQQQIQHLYLKAAQALRPDKTVLLSSVDMAELNRWIEEQLKAWRG
jgi:chorismate mutase